ncbi:MAG: hypothetical protein K9N62_03830 [Verrucomicrobia bacterium]|nr:hypothetical protein [Verrucomicrobiota bacterium]
MNPHQNFPPNKDAGAFTIREASVMARLGLHNKDDIRSIRTEFLVEDEDWSLIAGRVLWAAAGVEKAAAGIAAVPVVAAVAGLFDTPEQSGTAIKKAPPELNAEAWMMENAEVVRVVKSDLPNRRVLICLTDSGRRVTVLGVRDNRLFMPNSLTGRIYAFPDEGGTAAWLYAGPIVRGPALNPPSPKTRGRW